MSVNIDYQDSTGQLLIYLFFGEQGRGGEFKGIGFVKEPGLIVSVDPESGFITELVSDLTLPTGLCITDDFLQPIPTEGLPAGPLYVGFKHFSDRLLQIDLSQGTVELLATDLDTPSKLVIYKQSNYISEGMDLPVREISDINGES